MRSMEYPARLSPGDRVAIVSPSSGLPEILPLPFELGLKRLKDDFGLIPVEYPTTRRMGSSPTDRAADIHAAFADPAIKAVISSIGGDDQITVLPHLDAELLRANPKPFYGFSDCTSLLAYLADLGIVGYHGGAVMTAFGRPVSMHPLTEASLRAAMFDGGRYGLRESGDFSDMGRDWADRATFDEAPQMLPGTGWEWHGDRRVVTGTSWGGCLEVMAWMLMADRCIPADVTGAILFFETSEEMPTATEVYRILRSIGERGMLAEAGALLFGRPKAWSFDNQTDEAGRDAFVSEQRDAVLRAVGEYAPGLPVVLGIDIGHTDPQLILPYGGQITVDSVERSIVVAY
ncbi:MAG TPA: LD-carboxypeptidase [Candidatus Stackebrandtia excrementipullorum]|nr:LD-carboxypeptidase [Candidatus Stackebrandtia excrementipullorum]